MHFFLTPSSGNYIVLVFIIPWLMSYFTSYVDQNYTPNSKLGSRSFSAVWTILMGYLMVVCFSHAETVDGSFIGAIFYMFAMLSGLKEFDKLFKNPKVTEGNDKPKEVEAPKKDPNSSYNPYHVTHEDVETVVGPYGDPVFVNPEERKHNTFDIYDPKKSYSDETYNDHSPKHKLDEEDF